MSTDNGQALLSQKSLGDSAEWLHVRADSAEAPKFLAEKGLSPWVIDALTELETRPRALAHESGVLLVLRGVNADPGGDPEDMIALRVWLTQGLVVTARRRHRKLLAIEDLQQRIDRDAGPATVGQFVVQLVELLAERIGDFVYSIEENLVLLESQAEGESTTAPLRRELTVLRQQTASIRRYLAPQRDALEALFRARGALSDEDAYAIRDQTDRTIRYVEDLDLARERALVLQELLQQRVAEQQNARMYVLAIVSAIFLPLSFLSGIFGMNVGGLSLIHI